jgi:ankyrin repeat protein
MACAAYASPELLEFMVSKSDKPDLSSLLPYATGSVEKFKWLLEKGADPNTRTAKNVPILLLSLDRPEIMRSLLTAGADPNIIYYEDGKSALNSEPYTPLRAAVRYDGESGIRLTRMLIDAGAKPDELWMKKLLEGSWDSQKSATRELLFERFVIPNLVGGSAVIAAISNPNGIKPIEIAAHETGAPPDDLAKLLLQPRNSIEWSKASWQGLELWPEQITVWRKSDGSPKAIWKGRMTGAGEFPTLQWGDVVHLSFDLPKDSNTSSTYYSNENNLPHALHWALRKRISFPIQVEVDGQTRDYQMRGDRVAFDPTKPELPLVESGRLARLLCPDSINVDIVIHRKESPEIRTKTSGSSGSVTFEAHDMVKLAPIDSAETAKNRKDCIAEKAVGLPPSRTYAWKKEILAPTLIQVLADILSYQPGLSERFAPESSQMVEWLLHYNPQMTPVLWINPDLSKIRIRRLGEGGSEGIMEVNLAERIAASSGKTLTNDAAVADIPLQRGDIVEVTLKGDPDNSWTGLSAREAEFFGKILNCRVQVTDRQRKVSVNQLIFSPLKYVETEAGKLPVRSGESEMEISTLTPYSAFGYSMPTVIRDGVSFAAQPGYSVFLKEGDQISSDETIQPIRRSGLAPSNTRSSGPRPRVVPASPSR